MLTPRGLPELAALRFFDNSTSHQPHEQAIQKAKEAEERSDVRSSCSLRIVYTFFAKIEHSLKISRNCRRQSTKPKKKSNRICRWTPTTAMLLICSFSKRVRRAQSRLRPQRNAMCNAVQDVARCVVLCVDAQRKVRRQRKLELGCTAKHALREKYNMEYKASFFGGMNFPAGYCVTAVRHSGIKSGQV